MKHRRYSGVVAGALLFFSWGNFPPVFSQEVICCSLLWTVPGADWVGASRDCAGTMATITKQQKNKVCEAMAAFPGTCTDADCGVRPEDRCKKGEVPGSAFALSRTAGVGRMYTEPRRDATVVTNPPNGTRVTYKQKRRVNGETWYYVKLPGRPAGWIAQSETSCTRPAETPPPPLPRELDSGLTNERPVPAQVAGARG